jgi:hypothetical protein
MGMLRLCNTGAVGLWCAEQCIVPLTLLELSMIPSHRIANCWPCFHYNHTIRPANDFCTHQNSCANVCFFPTCTRKCEFFRPVLMMWKSIINRRNHQMSEISPCERPFQPTFLDRPDHCNGLCWPRFHFHFTYHLSQYILYFWPAASCCVCPNFWYETCLFVHIILFCCLRPNLRQHRAGRTMILQQ